MLYDVRNNIDEELRNTKSHLKQWLCTYGYDSVQKFLEFEKSGFKKTLKFTGKLIKKTFLYFISINY
jgi:hypothetical protein